MSEIHFSPSARYSNKIEMTNQPRRQNTIEVDGLLKKVREQTKGKPRIASEKPRRVQTIILSDDDFTGKDKSSMQPSQRIFAHQSNLEVERGRNPSRN